MSGRKQTPVCIDRKSAARIAVAIGKPAGTFSRVAYANAFDRNCGYCRVAVVYLCKVGVLRPPTRLLPGAPRGGRPAEDRKVGFLTNAVMANAPTGSSDANSGIQSARFCILSACHYKRDCAIRKHRTL